MRRALVPAAATAARATARSSSLSRHALVSQNACVSFAHLTDSGGCVRHKVTIPLASSDARRRLKPKLSKDKFNALAAAFFERVGAAVAPLHPPMNADFALDTAADGVLTIRASAKEFEIKVDAHKQQLLFMSPISGLRVYAWNQRTQRWEDESDSHDIEGLLTRDLMRVCSGVPSF